MTSVMSDVETCLDILKTTGMAKVIDSVTGPEYMDDKFVDKGNDMIYIRVSPTGLIIE